MPAPLFSIILPAYNERPRLPASLRLLSEYISGRRLDAEVLVVDDGSRDGTVEAATDTTRSPGWALPPDRFRIVRNPENRGKGYSIRQGLLAARGTWALFSDADLSTPIAEFEKLYTRAIEGQHDIVIGSRGLPDSNITLYQPFHRWLMGQTFNRIVRLMTGLPFHDTQCGFKLMARARVMPLVERTVVDRFAFDVELLYLAMKTGLSISEVAVTWHNSPVSRVGLIMDPANMLLDIAKVTRRYRKGGYRSRPAGPGDALGGKAGRAGPRESRGRGEGGGAGRAGGPGGGVSGTRAPDGHGGGGAETGRMGS